VGKQVTDDRFLELLSGPLGHRAIHIRLLILVTALYVVVDAGGKAADDALEAYCASIQEIPQVRQQDQDS
jgi:hypothetical protein